ncbi:MAG: S8 family peptidase [Halioglobus sp.]
MKRPIYTAVLFAIILLNIDALHAEPEELLVLLQGSSSTELASLVEHAGGRVTHDLHIINSVGARLSPEQFKKVLDSPLITRHLDDLADSSKLLEPLVEQGCKVRGHIEIQVVPEGLVWPLYNKREPTAYLEQLKFEWPPALGAVGSITLGGAEIARELYEDSAIGSMTLKFSPSDRLKVDGRTDLKVSFASPIPESISRTLQQRDFTLEASFTGGCSTDLVPGYKNNHEDFYYNEVGGVDALHLQGVTGRGVTVAVVDSGLWENDSLLNDTAGRGRVLARYDALTDTLDSEVIDESGHGTHMISVIANSDSTIRNGKPSGTYKGVAPDASLVAVKVLDRQGFAHVLEIVRAIQWVVDNRSKYNIRVLNLSFAQKPRWPYWEDPVDQAVMRAWADGIAVVAAAGNEGPDAETIGSPGNVPYIITVGAVTDSWTPNTRDDDYVPDFSSRGPTPSGHIKPDVVGLGGHITGLIHPQSAIAQDQPEDILSTGEFVSTGSSQASAFVSGILALLLQLEPDLTPDDLKCKLMTSAEPAINHDGKLAYSPFQQGSGYVTATRAVLLGRKGCGNLDWNIEADIAGHEHYYGPAIVGENGAPSLPRLDALVSSEPSDEGLSKSRRWGVKDHIERLAAEGSSIQPSVQDSPFDWKELYLQEKAAIEMLSSKPASVNQAQ